MEGVALQADQAIKNISKSLLSPKHQRGPGQFGGRGGKQGTRGGRGTRKQSQEKEKLFFLLSAFPQSVFSHEDGPARARV